MSATELNRSDCKFNSLVKATGCNLQFSSIEGKERRMFSFVILKFIMFTNKVHENDLQFQGSFDNNQKKKERMRKINRIQTN